MKQRIQSIVYFIFKIVGVHHWYMESQLIQYVEKHRLKLVKNKLPEPLVRKPITLRFTSFEYPKHQSFHGYFPDYITVLPTVRVFTNEGFLCLSSNRFILDTFWNPVNFPYYLLPAVFRSKIVKRISVGYSILLFWGAGYYHWMCDVLPRLIHILQYLPKETIFILPETLTPWQKDSLEELGLSKEKCVYIQSPLVVDCLWYNPPVAMTGDHRPDIVERLHQLFTKPFIGKPFRKLYISRRKAQKRCVVNEDALMEVLSLYGFERIDAESLSWSETKQLFFEAALIIAPHGAGLSNLLFCQKGIHVLELFEKNTLRRCFQGLAVSRGINHYFYEIETVDIGWKTEYNMSIDIHTFKKDFDQWLSQIWIKN